MMIEIKRRYYKNKANTKAGPTKSKSLKKQDNTPYLLTFYPNCDLHTLLLRSCAKKSEVAISC